MVHFQPFSHVKIWFIIQLIANHWEMVGFRVSWEIHSCNPIETSSGRSATRWQISVMRGKSTPKSWFSDIRRESWGCIKPQTCRWWFRNPKQPPRMEINPIDNWDKPTIFNWCKNFVHQQYDDIQGRLLSWSYLRSMSVCGQKASVENDSPPSLLETLRLGGERASWQMPKNRKWLVHDVLMFLSKSYFWIHWIFQAYIRHDHTCLVSYRYLHLWRIRTIASVEHFKFPPTKQFLMVKIQDSKWKKTFYHHYQLIFY